MSAGAVEVWRPRFHFTPRRHWMNDPNGLVYVAGSYHLFYQYSAEKPRYRAISWGHAVSRDLVRWRRLPVAIRRSAAGWAYSGNALVDREDRSGLGNGSAPCLAFFTNSRRSRTPDQHQTVDVAYSTDGGRRWRRYRRNPVADPGRYVFDAPFVFRYPADGDFRMLVGERLTPPTGPPGRFSLYRSSDLLRWKRIGQIGPFGPRTEVWEVPVLVRVPVRGRSRDRRWVLLWSIVDRTRGGLTSTRYIVGDFDGRAFHPERAGDTGQTLDFGPDVYAPLTWSDAPGPPTLLAWMSCWNYARRIPPTPSFAGGPLTMPRRLALEAGAEGLELAQEPLPALRKLRARVVSRSAIRLRDERRTIPVERGDGRSFELHMRWRRGAARRFGVRVRCGPGEATEIGIGGDGRFVYLDRRRSGIVDFAARFPAVFRAPLPDCGRRIELHVFVDCSSVEVFAAGGRRVLTAQIYPSAGSGGVELFAQGGHATLERLRLWPLRSIWGRS